MSIGGGFLIGVLIGYFLRKILKLVLFALGGILSLLVYLQYQGLMTMNMDRVQNIADKIIATLPNSISVKS
ncbi:MAG: FUN14 domain-containing protein, partial [Nitrososphaeraceae archaeon]